MALSINLAFYQTMCVKCKQPETENIGTLNLLGVTIESSLNFSDHAIQICKLKSIIQLIGALLKSDDRKKKRKEKKTIKKHKNKKKEAN